MYGDYNWTTDVVPQITAFMDNGLIKGGLIAIVSISIAVLAGRGLISVFFKRD